MLAFHVLAMCKKRSRQDILGMSRSPEKLSQQSLDSCRVALPLLGGAGRRRPNSRQTDRVLGTKNVHNKT
jgi:hypothetical protein